MSDNRSDKEREFFVTGAKTYLDVDEAMAQFRRTIQDQITTLVNGRLDEINRACEMDWNPNDLGDYTPRKPDCFQVGKQLTVKNIGGLYCGGLYFYFRIGRETGTLVYTTVVDLYRLRTNLAVDLWKHAADSNTASCKGTDIWFEQRVPSEYESPDFLKYLGRALDEFILFIGDSGGLKKHLPPRPATGGLTLRLKVAEPRRPFARLDRWASPFHARGGPRINGFPSSLSRHQAQNGV
jgi:hypothetical protein